MKFIHASGTRPLDGYTIKRGIGAGGFGEVYFAVSDAGKEVALKRIQRNLDIEIRGVSQCLNLKHVNLVALYDIKYDDHGDAWVVMEYVSGESLRDAIEKSPNGMQWDDVNAWFQGMATGVAYLHDHGIVHRDLKPGNIFSDEGVVKIGDYGLSKFISCSRRSGHTESVGTFHYMAPEIGRGSYGKEIDVYALGVILYEMLTGHVPFDGETSQEIIMKHLTASPDLAAVPLPYREVVRKALLKDPTRRFPEVLEMLGSLGLSPGVGRVAPVNPIQPPINGHSQPEKIPAPEQPTQPAVAAVEQAPITPQSLVVAELVREEPVAAAVRRGWRQINQFWRQVESPSRVILIVVTCFLLITNSAWLVPLAVALGSMYLVYFGIYSLVTAVATPNPPPQTVPTWTPPPIPVQPVVATPPREQRRERWHGVEDERAILKNRSLAEHAGDLVGAMLMSTLVVAVLVLILLAAGGHRLDSTLDTWSFYTWYGLTCVAGTWSILGLGKLWEQDTGDQMRRRFVMLIVGLAVGSASYGLSQYLMVNLYDAMPMRPITSLSASSHFYDSSGRPALAGFWIYFGAVFGIIRWWKLADPLRYARLNVWDTGVCALFAWGMQMFWSFWQPWGIMAFVTIAIAVQMSSRWISPAERKRR